MGAALGTMIAGAVLGIGGTYLAGSAASARRRELAGVANTPGVDIGKVYDETLAGAQNAQGRSQNLAHETNTFNQTEIDRLIEDSIPGYKLGQAQRIKNTMALMHGDIPEDVSANVARASAAKSMEGGYGGSGASRALTARDLGQTSLDLQSLGQSQFSNIIGTSPMATPVSGDKWMNIDPKTGLGLRSNERSEKLDILTAKAKSPSEKEVWGKQLMAVGGQLVGASGFGGGG